MTSLTAAAARTCAAVVATLTFATTTMAGTVYVTSEKDDAVTMIDTATLAVKGTIPTCKRGRHIQLMPDGKIMLACSDSSQADIIDPATNKSVKRIPLGDDPEAFDISPDGKTIYVSKEDDAEAAFLDAATGKELKSTKVGQEPEGVKVSADGKVLYVTSEVASLVHAIDTTTGKIIKNIKTEKRPRRMAFANGGKELWVTCELGAAVTVINTADNSVLAKILFEVKGVRAEDITPVGITMSPDGKQAYVALGRSNHVAFVDVASRKVTNLVLVGKRAWNVALDKAGQRLYVVNGLSDDLTVIDVAGAKPLKSVPVGRVPYGVVVVE